MQQDIKFRDVVNWSKLGVVGGILLACAGFYLFYWTTVMILTKQALDNPANWNQGYAGLGAAIVGALIALVVGWRSTTGQAAVVLKAEPPVPSSQEETVDVLIQKMRHRMYADAAENLLKTAGGTR